MQPTALAILPRVPITVRVATAADLPFMDALQKLHSKQLGYFPMKQFQGYIEQQAVLIAEEGTGFRVQGSGETEASSSASLNPEPRTLNPVGYCISKDRYLKRDELGVIYQLCVAPGNQRKLIGASLLKAVFERSAYGCRLYCCWCAQDLAANHFWESMGFVPVAFRAGGGGNGRKRRVHIFWQRRIDAEQSQIANRQSAIPYWYPSQTNAGAIREDRLVFPIPPGTHWSEVRSVELPVASGQLPVIQEKRRRSQKSSLATGNSQLATISSGGLRFAAAKDVEPARVKAKREKAPKVRIDPKYVAAARELRDRYLEQVNGPMLAAPRGKYDVSRTLIEGSRLPRVEQRPAPLLKAG